MRTVPASAPLMVNALRSTKHGRSDGPPSACQSTAAPSGPAIDVNVPHSWTVSAIGSLVRVEAGVAEDVIAETITAVMEWRIWSLLSSPAQDCAFSRPDVWKRPFVNAGLPTQHCD